MLLKSNPLQKKIIPFLLQICKRNGLLELFSNFFLCVFGHCYQRKLIMLMTLSSAGWQMEFGPFWISTISFRWLICHHLSEASRFPQHKHQKVNLGCNLDGLWEVLGRAATLGINSLLSFQVEDTQKTPSWPHPHGLELLLETCPSLNKYFAIRERKNQSY